tara:strand:+ start:269 stop:496 length:228 start_codon:yes stop_codon:yes gene_type:complete
MEEQKRNLVENAIGSSMGGYTKPEFLKVFLKKTKEEIKELARAELKIVESIVKIERNDFSYWKNKKTVLKNIINE